MLMRIDDIDKGQWTIRESPQRNHSVRIGCHVNAPFFTVSASIHTITATCEKDHLEGSQDRYIPRLLHPFKE